MLFSNRDDAAHRLAGRLTRYRGQDPLILAIPRGAVPMGKILAEALGGELDVALVRKLGAPGNPELAIGSVAENGEIAISEWTRRSGISEDYIEREAQRQLATLAERRRLYTPGRQAIDVAGRVVIVLDDGVATGSTLSAALELARARGPARLVAATAVAPPEALQRLTRLADEVVCLASPRSFEAVSLFFDDFSQVTDHEVIAILSADHDRAASPVPAQGFRQGPLKDR